MVAKSVVAASAVATSAIVAKIASRWVEPKSLIRWGSRHVVAGVVIRTGMRAGDPFARLCGDPALREYPYDFYDEIRASELLPGRFALVTARHELVLEILRTPGEFLSGFPDETLPRPLRAAVSWARDPAVLNGGDRPSMLMSNGAEHARYRRLAMRAFTARAVAGLAGRIEEMAAELLDGMQRRGGGDLITDYAQLLPVLVIAEILGVPTEMRHTFLHWARPIVPMVDFGIGYPRFRQGEASLRELNAWFQGHFARLRREPGTDLLSSIVVAAQEEADGAGVDDVGLMVNSTLLLVAGFETTVNLIGNGSVLLMTHPEQLARLQADPVGWANAVDEVLRFDSPVQNTIRYPSHDSAVRGIPIRRGQFIVLLTGGANRDPAVFDDPNTFDVTRGNAREHLSFSAGPHFCAGAALARLEGEIGLRLLFERFPGLSLAGELRRRPTRVIRGFAAIPVRLGAGC
ncbi:MAG: cytochrome P450 [Pseudonocardiaceae bacterium]